MEQRPPKPKFPQKIYRWFGLWETITDWVWIEPGSKEANFFKPGWRALKKPNYNHPLQRWGLRQVKKEQEKVLGRKKVNWKELEKVIIEI